MPLTTLINGGDPSKPVELPCGKCIGCRLEYSRQWAMRCMHEAQTNECNSYVTLTYNDKNLTYGHNQATLVPKDLQLFLKRLRKKTGKKISYYACGEYGDATKRPHYHLCIFGYDFPDKIHVETKRDFKLYESRLLSGLWKAGIHRIGEVTFESAAYVARYIMKKQKGATKKIYSDLGIEPEFARMSLKPGIGASATWELADYQLTHGKDNPDVPSALRHGRRILPLGRYLRRLVRARSGISDGRAPQETLDAQKKRLSVLWKAAQSITENVPLQEVNFRNLILKAGDGKVAQMEARSRIFKKRQTL